MMSTIIELLNDDVACVYMMLIITLFTGDVCCIYMIFAVITLFPDAVFNIYVVSTVSMGSYWQLDRPILNYDGLRFYYILTNVLMHWMSAK